MRNLVAVTDFYQRCTLVHLTEAILLPALHCSAPARPLSRHGADLCLLMLFVCFLAGRRKGVIFEVSRRSRYILRVRATYMTRCRLLLEVGPRYVEVHWIG